MTDDLGFDTTRDWHLRVTGHLRTLGAPSLRHLRHTSTLTVRLLRIPAFTRPTLLTATLSAAPTLSRRTITAETLDGNIHRSTVTAPLGPRDRAAIFGAECLFSLPVERSIQPDYLDGAAAAIEVVGLGGHRIVYRQVIPEQGDILPLVQTLAHLETLLRHPRWMAIRARLQRLW